MEARRNRPKLESPPDILAGPNGSENPSQLASKQKNPENAGARSSVDSSLISVPSTDKSLPTERCPRVASSGAIVSVPRVIYKFRHVLKCTFRQGKSKSTLFHSIINVSSKLKNSTSRKPEYAEQKITENYCFKTNELEILISMNIRFEGMENKKMDFFLGTKISLFSLWLLT